jgi:hypothetical protein
VDEDAEFCRGRQAVQDLDPPAVRRAERAVQIVDVLNGNALRRDRRLEGTRPSARIAGSLRSLRQRFAVGLFIEDVRRAETHDGLGVAVRGLGVLATDDRSENRDALFAFANEPPEFAPGVEACHARRVGPLPRDQTLCRQPDYAARVFDRRCLLGADDVLSLVRSA